jgi:hypothetical protein
MTNQTPEPLPSQSSPPPFPDRAAAAPFPLEAAERQYADPPRGVPGWQPDEGDFN